MLNNKKTFLSWLQFLLEPLSPGTEINFSHNFWINISKVKIWRNDFMNESMNGIHNVHRGAWPSPPYPFKKEHTLPRNVLTPPSPTPKYSKPTFWTSSLGFPLVSGRLGMHLCWPNFYMCFGIIDPYFVNNEFIALWRLLSLLVNPQ